MSINYANPFIKKNMFKGSFGLEKESLRVDQKGFLSHTKHPFNNPNIDRDFCENQVEVITDVCDSTEALYAEIKRLHKSVILNLSELKSGQELLWSFSNPPYVKGENDIPIAKFNGGLKGKELYREYLAEKYGKKKMLFSGIHYNFSFSDDVLEASFNDSGDKSCTEHKNKIYLNLAKKLTQYGWLIVYLTAASPVMDGSFFKDDAMGKDLVTSYSSVRCSEIGYWNKFIPLLNYNTLEDYICSIQSYVDCGKLKSVSELYYPIRLKPLGGNSLEALRQSGINHIELRMLDLNPLSPVGIMKEDIDFIHLLIIYLTSLRDDKFEQHEQLAAIKNIKKAAQFDDEKIFIESEQGKNIVIRTAALEIMSSIEDFFAKYGQQNALNIIKYQRDKILQQENRYAVIIKNTFGNNYVQKGIELAKKYADTIKKEV